MKRIRLPFVFLLFLGMSLLASCRLRVRTLDEGQTGQALLQRGKDQASAPMHKVGKSQALGMLIHW